MDTAQKMKEKENWVEVMRDLQGYFKSGERKAIYNSCGSLRDKVLIRLLWKSGRRISEILNLKVGEINFDDRNILWHISKKKKGIDFKRLKPIDDFTLGLLDLYIKENGLNAFEYVLYGTHPKITLSRQRAFQIVRKACYKAGIYYVGNKKPHPHHFRHSFAIDVVKRAQSASDIRKLQMLLEHSSLSTTENYLQFASEDLRPLIESDED